MSGSLPSSGDGMFPGNHFRVDQRFRVSTNVYEVSVGGVRAAWVRQKIMALRERLEIWTDESKSTLVCAVQGRAVLEARGTYGVTGGAGEPLGVLKKQFGRSLLRSTWHVEAADGTLVASVTETSLAVALVRRAKGLLDLVPVVGWVLSLLPLPIPIAFTWTDPATGAEIGRYRRLMGIRDHYELDLPGDPGRRIDRRLAIAMAICLDALQSR